MGAQPAEVPADDFDRGTDGDAVAPIVALRDLAAARRRNRAAGVDVFQGFYQAYVTAFGCGAAVLLASDAIGDVRLSAPQVRHVTADGPGFIGLAIAAVLAVAVRSGSRGGPLVLSAADVRHVLLAPVPRDAALRRPAVRQIRFSSFVGLVAGAGLGVLASHRLPGGIPGWALTGAGVGAVVGATAAAVALSACGARVRPWLGLLIAVALLGWSGIDVALGRTTSPMALFGQLALIPVKFHPSALGVLAATLLAAVVGVARIGRMSLEQAERRATLASQIRFALTLQDLRTVVLLRRQLTQEQSRPRPWVRLGPLTRGRRVVWRRDLRGVTRWPAVRFMRLAALGAITGAALVGAWAGTTPLVVAAAIALFLAGLEALEPLAQDIDHPDLPSATPSVPGQLRIAHIPVTFAVMVAVALAGWGTALILAAAGVASTSLVLQVGPPLVVPAALMGLVGAVVSVVMGPPSAGGDLLPAEIAGVKLVVRAVLAPGLVVIGLTPLFVAHSAFRHHLAVGSAAASAAILPVMVGIIGLGWVRFKEDLREYMSAPAPAKPKSDD